MSSGATSPVVEAARRLRTWAVQKGLLTNVQPDQDDVDDVDLADFSNVTQSATAEQIFTHRRINLICVDEPRKIVIVYTNKSPTQKEQDELPATSDGGVTFEFRKGALPQIKNTGGGPTPGGTFELHKGIYTCGSSVFVGNKIGAGTMGAILKDKGGKFFGLSNNHVTGGMSFSETLLPVVAPGTVDVCPGGHDPFTLGHHKAALPLVLGSPDNSNVANNYDAAVFTIRDPNLVSSMQRKHYDTPASVMSPQANTVVEKVGRTTGRTRGSIVGRVVAPEPVIARVPEFGFSSQIYFEDVWVVEGLQQNDFSRPGDSGSLVCFRPNQGQPKAVGIIFAGSTKSLTFIAPIDKILASLGMELVFNHNV